MIWMTFLDISEMLSHASDEGYFQEFKNDARQKTMEKDLYQRSIGLKKDLKAYVIN